MIATIKHLLTNANAKGKTMTNMHSEEPVRPPLEIIDMHAVCDALEAAEAALLGIINQPRCGEDARDEIDVVLEAVSEKRYAMIESIRAAKPRDQEDVRKRAEILLRFFFENGETDTAEFREIAASICGEQS
jgi:hypothetical protein